MVASGGHICGHSSTYRVPNGWTQLTSDYNLFFILTKEQDKNTWVNLQKIITQRLTNASVQCSENHDIFQEKLHGQSLPWHAQPPLVQEPVCFVSFQGNIWWWFGYIWRIEKKKSERKRSESLMLKCLLCWMSKWFRFVLFQQIGVPSE